MPIGTPGASFVTGGSIPAELAAFKPLFQDTTVTFDVCMVAYTGTWNATSDKPQIAYYWKGWAQTDTYADITAATGGAAYGGEFGGVGYVANASVSTTPVVQMTYALIYGTASTTKNTANAICAFDDQNFKRSCLGADTKNNGDMYLYNNLGEETFFADANFLLDGAHTISGGGISCFTANGSGNVNQIAFFPNSSVTVA
jgi:hypothetical protein